MLFVRKMRQTRQEPCINKIELHQVTKDSQSKPRFRRCLQNLTSHRVPPRPVVGHEALGSLQ